MRLNHFALVNTSEKNAKIFYEKLFGFKELKVFTVPTNLSSKIFNSKREYKVIVYYKNNIKIEVFIDQKFKQKENPLSHICLEVENRESLIEKCKLLGVNYLKIPKENSYYLFLRDFDGNLFEIKEID